MWGRLRGFGRGPRLLTLGRQRLRQPNHHWKCAFALIHKLDGCRHALTRCDSRVRQRQFQTEPERNRERSFEGLCEPDDSKRIGAVASSELFEVSFHALLDEPFLESLDQLVAFGYRESRGEIQDARWFERLEDPVGNGEAFGQKGQDLITACNGVRPRTGSCSRTGGDQPVVNSLAIGSQLIVCR